MKRVWNLQKDEMPDVTSIIDAGLDKLEEYRERADVVPAFVLAMGKHIFFVFHLPLLTHLLAINPAIKLEWIYKHMPEQLHSAKQLFLHEVFPLLFNTVIPGLTNVLRSYGHIVKKVLIHQLGLSEMKGQQQMRLRGLTTFLA